jgi:hypothetical protein
MPRGARRRIPQAPHRLALSDRPERLLPARPGDQEAAAVGPQAQRRRALRHPRHRPGPRRHVHARRHRARRRRRPVGAQGIAAETAFGKLVAQMQPYTPEWAEKVCDVREGTVRRIAAEYLEQAQVGATMEVDGETLPYRPVAIQFGRTVNNGWGAYECCWARTLLACLVGGLEVPGGTLGTTVRLNRPATTRQASVKINPDGFMHYPMNPTDKATWAARPKVRNAHDVMVPLSASSPWSTALGPTHFSWMFQKESPENWPRSPRPTSGSATAPTPRSRSGTPRSCPAHRRVPLHRRLRLPPRRDQPHGGRAAAREHRHREHAADPHRRQQVHRAVLGPRGLRPAPARRETAGQTRDFTDIATELAAQAGLLEKYNEAINRGAAGVPLSNHALGLQARSRQEARRRDDLGACLPRRQRRADRRQARRTASTGSSSTACARGRSRACPGISFPS